jgi:hypothetical protein
MSSEGVTFVARIALVVLLIVLASFVRAVAGPGRRRGRVMAVGTVGGIAAGVAVASVLSPWIGADVSVICACLGMSIGWALAWPSVRRIPREAD